MNLARDLAYEYFRGIYFLDIIFIIWDILLFDRFSWDPWFYFYLSRAWILWFSYGVEFIEFKFMTLLSWSSLLVARDIVGLSYLKGFVGEFVIRGLGVSIEYSRIWFSFQAVSFRYVFALSLDVLWFDLGERLLICLDERFGDYPLVMI